MAGEARPGSLSREVVSRAASNAPAAADVDGPDTSAECGGDATGTEMRPGDRGRACVCGVK